MWEGSVAGAAAPGGRAIVLDQPDREEVLAAIFAPPETAGGDASTLHDRLADAWEAHARRPMRPGMIFGYARRQLEALATDAHADGPDPAWALVHADQVWARWAIAGEGRVLRYRAGAVAPALSDAKHAPRLEGRAAAGERPEHPAEGTAPPEAEAPRTGRGRLRRGDAFLLCLGSVQGRLETGPVARNLYNADLDEAVRSIAQDVGSAGRGAAAAPLAVLRFGLPHEGEPELTAAGRANLGSLIAVCNDSLDVFDDAVRHIDDPRVARLFEQMREARLQARALLAKAIASIDGAAPEEGTLSGAAHHLFAQLRGTLGGHQPTVVLRELEETEERVRRHFVQALAVKMPHHVEEAIRAALEEILLSHDLLYAMSEAAETAG